ncbi:MAG: AbrB/MazE/SpoVT family DNA-binding domain-containing protein [Longimicrobiales bacterium]|nr:AbrB/MazE/SpoVT family DNA-binding domain-containing protein [Longimicrobiales bacterium]
MVTRVQKWGNSQGLRVSKELLADAGIDVGDEVEVAVRDGVLLVTPLRRVRGGHDLRELVRSIPPGVRVEEVDWGAPAGREVW